MEGCGGTRWNGWRLDAAVAVTRGYITQQEVQTLMGGTQAILRTDGEGGEKKGLKAQPLDGAGLPLWVGSPAMHKTTDFCTAHAIGEEAHWSAIISPSSIALVPQRMHQTRFVEVQKPLLQAARHRTGFTKLR